MPIASDRSSKMRANNCPVNLTTKFSLCTLEVLKLPDMAEIKRE